MSLEIRALTWMILIAACAGCAARLSEPSPAQWEQVHQDVAAMLSLQNEFAKNHKFVGKTIGTAISQLESEGFKCFLEQKMLPQYSASDGKFSSKAKTLAYCWLQRRKDVQKICEVMWANFEVKWVDQAHPSLLVASGARSFIERETYFCKPLHITPLGQRG